MNKNHIKLIKHKQKIKEKRDHKERYNKACDNAVEQKQQREISKNKKQIFQLQHLFASMIFGFIAGISVMFTVDQLKSKKEETNPPISKKVEKRKNKIAVTSSIDPAIMQYKSITPTPAPLITKKKAVIIPIEKKISNQDPRRKHQEIKEASLLAIKPTGEINKNLKYSPFAGLKKVDKTPEELRRQKIRDLQNRVKNAAKQKKYIKSASRTRKEKDVNQGFRECKTKKQQQKQNKQTLNTSLPPDIAAEMMR